MNGETPATIGGKQAHGEFPDATGSQKGSKLPGGRIPDAIKETDKNIYCRELKPDGRICPDGDGVVKGSKAKEAIKQVAEYGDDIPNPKKKGIILELWGWTWDATKKRFVFIKRIGWKKGGKMIPLLGTVVTVLTVTSDVEAKGVVPGLFNSGLDAIPCVGTIKGVAEVIAGEEMVPDKDKQPPKRESGQPCRGPVGIRPGPDSCVSPRPQPKNDDWRELDKLLRDHLQH